MYATVVEASRAYVVGNEEEGIPIWVELPFAVVYYGEQGIAQLQAFFRMRRDADEYVADKQYKGELP